MGPVRPRVLELLLLRPAVSPSLQVNLPFGGAQRTRGLLVRASFWGAGRELS